MLVAVVVGVVSRLLDRRYARLDGERLREHSPLSTVEPVRAVESLVHNMILRWLVVGGVEVLLGVGLVVAALQGLSMLGLGEAGYLRVIAAVVPSVGAALALSFCPRQWCSSTASFSARCSGGSDVLGNGHPRPACGEH